MIYYNRILLKPPTINPPTTFPLTHRLSIIKIVKIEEIEDQVLNLFLLSHLLISFYYWVITYTVE